MSNYRNIAGQAADKYGINRVLFLRQMKQEAGFGDPTSPKGAQGPAQIMPATARAWGVKNVHDPHEAYDAAARNMAHYLKKYGGSWSKALTAYNAGEGRVGKPLYAETRNYIKIVTGGKDVADAGGAATPAGRASMTAGRAPTLTPASSTTDQKGAMVAALLDHRKGMSLFDRFQSQINSGGFTTNTPAKLTPGIAPQFKAGAPGSSAAPSAGGGGLKARADLIDSQKRPYLWGGGHGGNSYGLDCSGAVSKLLGINPRVAAEFMKWGKPGRGKDLTIWAKSSHVLVEIGGRFWGTSRSNPGGGAGWIERNQVSTAGFTPRHP